MHNSVILVGRVAEKSKLYTVENRIQVSLVVAVPRAFKNVDGIYETDSIEFILWDSIGASNTVENCQKGDLVGIKGRLQNNSNKIEVIAEKITFLSAKQS